MVIAQYAWLRGTKTDTRYRYLNWLGHICSFLSKMNEGTDQMWFFVDIYLFLPNLACPRVKLREQLSAVCCSFFSFELCVFLFTFFFLLFFRCVSLVNICNRFIYKEYLFNLFTFFLCYWSTIDFPSPCHWTIH